MGGDGFDGGAALGAEHRPGPAPVVGAGLPGDQAACFEPADVVGEAAAGLDRQVGELGHAEPSALGLRQGDEDAVVVVGEALGLEVGIERVDQPA